MTAPRYEILRTQEVPIAGHTGSFAVIGVDSHDGKPACLVIRGEVPLPDGRVLAGENVLTDMELALSPNPGALLALATETLAARLHDALVNGHDQL